MSAPNIEVTLSTPRVQPGDEITGTVRVDGDKKIKAVSVQLVEGNMINVFAGATSVSDLFMANTGDRGGHNAHLIETPHGSQDLAVTGDEQPFTLTVPLDAPPTAFDFTRPPEMRRLVSWQVRAKVTHGWRDVETFGQAELQVLSPSAEYAAFAEEAPVAKSDKCPVLVHVDSREASPGDRIAGTVEVTPREPIDGKGVTVRLGYHRGDPSGTIKVMPWGEGNTVELSGPSHLDAAQTHTFPFSFTLPDSAPPTYATPNVRLHWYVEALVEAHGILGRIHSGETQFVVHSGEWGGLSAGSAPTGGAATLDELVAFVAAPPPNGKGDRELEDQKCDAVRTIAQSSDPRAVTALMSLLDIDTGFVPKLTETKKTVRNTVIERLGELRDPRAVEALVALLHTEAAAWREAASQTGETGGLAKHEMISDRFKAAAHSLAEIGDPRAIPELTAEWENKSNVFIRKSAKKAADALSRQTQASR